MRKRIFGKRVTYVILLILFTLLLAGTLILRFALPAGSGAGNFSGGQSYVQVQESVLSAAAESGSVTSSLIAGGTLEPEEADTVSLPGSVEVETYAVSNGDTVEAGDLIAVVDQTSVVNGILEVQEKINEVDEALAEESEKEGIQELTAPADGRVKKVYAREGTSVLDTMYETGALILLSLDGNMAVDIEDPGTVQAGDSLRVTLADGTVTDGTAAAVADGILTVTISDKEGAYGEEVQVSDDSGEHAGSGTLYIHSELKITGYSGITEEISVKEGKNVEKGDGLITLENTEQTAEYIQLKYQRQILEDQMTRLFQIYQTGEIYADEAGEVSGLNEDIVIQTGSMDAEYSVELLVNSPTGQDMPVNYVGKVTSVSGATVAALVSPEPVSNIDYTDLSGSGVSEEAFTESVTVEAGSVSVYTWQDGSWHCGTVTDLKAGDLVVFAYYEKSGQLLWIVKGTSDQDEDPSGEGDAGTEDDAGEEDGSGGSEEGTEGEGGPGGSENSPEEGGTGEEDGSGGSEGGTEGEDGSGGNEDGTEGESSSGGNASDGSGEYPDGQIDSGLSQGSGSVPDISYGSGNSSGNSFGGGYGSFSDGSGSGSLYSGGTLPGSSSAEEDAEEESASYTVSETQIYSLTSRDTMSVSITVDELDIRSLSVGQQAEITLDALSGQSFTGEITQINGNGTNSGGNTKYTVTVTMERTGEMLTGMNASVVIETNTQEGCILIPEAALMESETGTYVYTSYEEGRDELGGLTEVETGAADGTNVEIISGLEEGSTVYYRYADSIQYTFLSAS